MRLARTSSSRAHTLQRTKDWQACKLTETPNVLADGAAGAKLGRSLGSQGGLGLGEGDNGGAKARLSERAAAESAGTSGLPRRARRNSILSEVLAFQVPKRGGRGSGGRNESGLIRIQI